MAAPPITDVSLYTVSEAAKANQEGEFLFDSMPTVISRPKKSGFAGVTYKDAALQNALLSANGYAVDWNEAAPAAMDWDEGEVEVQLQLTQTAPLPIPDDTTNEMHRFLDVQNAAEMAVSMAGQAADRVIISALTGTGFSSETFSGTGCLDVYPSDASPAQDIRGALESYRPYQSFSGFELVARLDETYMNVLAGYTSFQVAGMAFDSDGKLWTTERNRQTFAAAFMQATGVDRVVIRRGVYNSAKRGATAVVERLHKGLLWIGIEDVRQNEWDLTTQGYGPSGSVAFATDRTGIYTKRWNVGGGSEEDRVNGRFNLDVVTPLYTAHGITAGSYWPDGEVFT